MELGKRLRQARQDAGLSQRQLCGDRITRNMLSQIENGSARPSMDTLQYFAQKLGKPVSFFLEEQPLLSPDQLLMQQLRGAEPQQVLQLLEAGQAPDAQFDDERYLLEALACLSLAQTAITQGKHLYAAKLLEQAAQAGSKTPYYSMETERRRLLLCYRAKTQSAAKLAQSLPSLDEELLLRAQAALEMQDADRCQCLLEAAEQRDGRWRLLKGKALLLQKDYASAASHLQKAESEDASQVYALLEQCYSALGDYKLAYEYACKQREMEKTNTSFFMSSGV